MKLFYSILPVLFTAQIAHAGQVEFYEGGSQGGDRVGTLPDHQQADLKLKNGNIWGGANDEIRSIKLKWVTPGTMIEVFDSPSASRNEDYAQIVVKRWAEEIPINGLESNRSNGLYDMVYVKQDGNLNGKVSRIKLRPGKAIEPPLEARLNLCMQEQYQFKKKHGTAYEFKSQDSSYRTYYPDIDVKSAGIINVTWKINHIRGGMQKDDYSSIKMEFDENQVLQDFSIDTKIADKKYRTDADKLFDDLPEEAKKNPYGIIAEVGTKAGASLYDFASETSETGGRANFPNVIERVIDKYGSAIAECSADRFAAELPDPDSDDEFIRAEIPPPVAVPSHGKYQYSARFETTFKSPMNITLNKRLRVCARDGDTCVWGSDDSSPSVNGCRKMRLAVGKKIAAYGYPGKMLSSSKIKQCNRAQY